MSTRHKGAGDWPFCGPEPRSASSLCSLPGPVQFDGLRFRGQTTASGNSWAVGTLVMSLVRSRNCLERWEENVFEDLRQCSTTLQKGGLSLSSSLSDLSRKRTFPSNLPHTGQDLPLSTCATPTPLLPSFIKASSLQYNLHTIKFTSVGYTDWYILSNLYSWITTAIIRSRTFPSSHKVTSYP